MKQMEYDREYPKNNREYKSSVFCKLFSNPKELLELYNALNGTSYQDPSELEIYTVESTVYITRRDDVAFIIDFVLNIYEHQSTINPNMPLRGLLHFAQEYNKYVESNQINLYKRTLQKIPTPKFVIFYNGEAEQPDRKVLRLSEAFENKDQKGCLECEAILININYGQNKELLEKCKILKEYAIFVEIVRKYMKQNPDNPKKAFHEAIEECINNNILRDFLISQRAEVLELMLNTFHREWYERDLREEALAEGLEEGRAKGFEQGMEEGLAEGREKGLAEGREKGLAEGRNNLLIKQIQKKLAKGQSVEEIADALEVAVEEIKECIAKMEN